MDVKELYSEIRGKNKDLPSFEELDSEFEISTVEERFPLRNIRRKIAEKVEYYSKIIEELLQPDTNLIPMYECRVFREDEKEDIYDVLKKLMFILRSSSEVALKSDEKEDVKFISDAFKGWTNLKPDLSKIIAKIKSSWEKETELKEDLEYLG